MADRVTKVSLVAEVSNYIAGMEKASAKTKELGTSAEKLAKQKEGLDRIGASGLAIGTVAAAGVAVAVAKFAEFQKEMSQVQTLSHATADQMKNLSDAALTMGQSIGFSATQVAEGETELVKAGVSVSQIMGGALKGSLDLAAAGQISVADATSTAAVAMTQFGLAGSQVPHVADLLAAGADKALGSVGDLGQALNQGGLVASQFGLSIDDTVGTLSAFANAGLLGSDAGTSLKQMFLQLASPSKQASELMQKLGINAYDASGQFVGITKFAGILQKQLGGLSEQQRNSAESIIFGSDAIRGANVLYQEGADGISNWVSDVNDTGFAAEQAQGKMDNLSGDLTKLGAAFDTSLIKSGSAANGILRTLAQDVTGLVSTVGNLPAPVVAAGLGIAAVTAAIGLAGGSALIAIPKFVAFKESLELLGISGKTAVLSIGGIGLALGAATLALGYFANQQAQVSANTAKLKDTLDQTTGAITDATRASIARTLADDGSLAAADKAGISQKQVIDAVLKGGDAANKVGNQIREANNNLGDFFSGNSFGADKAGTSIANLGKSVDNSRQSFADLKAAGVGVSDSTDTVSSTSADAATNLTDLSGAAQTGTQSLSDLEDAINGFGSAQLNVDSATRDFQAAIDDVSSTIDSNTQTFQSNAKAYADGTDKVNKNTDAYTANGKSLDTATAEGRANQAALEKIASSSLKVSSATLAQTGNQDAATAAVKQGRDAFIAAAEKLGLSADAAGKYADKLGLIPGNVNTAITQTGVNPALAALDALINKINNVPGYKAVVIDQQIKQTGAARGAVGAAYNADGGAIEGPGTGTSDSILSYVSNGEHVLTASDVAKAGGQAAIYRLRAAIQDGSAPRFAGGGAVGFATGGATTKAAKAAAAALKKQQAAAAKAAKEFAKLSSEQFSFLSDVARGNLTGTSAVDSLYSTASSRTGVGQIAMLNTALKFDRSLTSLTAKSDKAASSLSDLQSSSSSLASSVTSNVGKTSFGYTTAAGLSRGLARTAGNVKEFAGLLTTLGKKGVAPALLSEIANLGTVQGLPLARSLAKDTAADIKSINSSYASIQSYSAQAGQTVADANYKAQIAAADKNARSLEYQIAKQSLAIQRVIGHALKVPGYATGGYTGHGARDQVAGIVHAGEYVSTAATVARPGNRQALEYMQSGGTINGYQQGGYVQPTYVRSAPAVQGISSDQLLAAIKSIPRGDSSFVIQEAKDPVGTAVAVARRMNARSV